MVTFLFDLLLCRAEMEGCTCVRVCVCMCVHVCVCVRARARACIPFPLSFFVCVQIISLIFLHLLASAWHLFRHLVCSTLFVGTSRRRKMPLRKGLFPSLASEIRGVFFVQTAHIFFPFCTMRSLFFIFTTVLSQ